MSWGGGEQMRRNAKHRQRRHSQAGFLPGRILGATMDPNPGTVAHPILTIFSVEKHITGHPRNLGGLP